MAVKIAMLTIYLAIGPASCVAVASVAAPFRGHLDLDFPYVELVLFGKWLFGAGSG